jgi:biopolymer transport protein ExbB
MLASDTEALEAVERATRRAAAVVHAELQSGLRGLATVVSLAPFVALLGTVVEIPHAFKGCAGAASLCMAADFEGLWLALIPTVLGFMVAIPAWLGYKYLKGNLEVLDLEMKNTAGLLVNYLSVYLSVRRA